MPRNLGNPRLEARRKAEGRLISLSGALETLVRYAPLGYDYVSDGETLPQSPDFAKFCLSVESERVLIQFAKERLKELRQCVASKNTMDTINRSRVGCRFVDFGEDRCRVLGSYG